jgi:hypothetical protein
MLKILLGGLLALHEHFYDLGAGELGGGYSPLESISRTLVPETKTWFSLEWGQVLVVPMPWHVRQKKECSKKSGVSPISPSSNSSKMCWAS